MSVGVGISPVRPTGSITPSSRTLASLLLASPSFPAVTLAEFTITPLPLTTVSSVHAVVAPLARSASAKVTVWPAAVATVPSSQLPETNARLSGRRSSTITFVAVAISVLLISSV